MAPFDVPGLPAELTIISFPCLVSFGQDPTSCNLHLGHGKNLEPIPSEMPEMLDRDRASVHGHN